MCNGAKEYGSDRSRKMLKNEYLLAKFGVDTEENELSKVACLPPSPLSIKDLWAYIVPFTSPGANIPSDMALALSNSSKSGSYITTICLLVIKIAANVMIREHAPSKDL